MTADDIASIYNELAQVPQSAATIATEALGQQQAAQGGLAAAMGATGGNGIGQYTYDRMIMPTVDSLTAQLVAEGKQAQYNALMEKALKAAKQRYSNAVALASQPKTNDPTVPPGKDIPNDKLGDGKDYKASDEEIANMKVDLVNMLMGRGLDVKTAQAHVDTIAKAHTDPANGARYIQSWWSNTVGKGK